MTRRPRRDCACPVARHQHGTQRAYVADRCRCLPCRAAHANATTSYRNGGSWQRAYIDATDTKRRLRALAAAGVTTRRIATHAGISADMVTYLRSGKQLRVTPRHADIVARAYDALWLTGRNDPDARRTMTIVRAIGYESALDDSGDDEQADLADDLDQVAIAEAMTGRRVHLTQAETAEAVARLTATGHSADEIGERLGLSGRTVVRFRSRAGETVAA